MPKRAISIPSLRGDTGDDLLERLKAFVLEELARGDPSDPLDRALDCLTSLQALMMAMAEDLGFTRQQVRDSISETFEKEPPN